MSTKVSTDLIDLSGNTGGLVWAKGPTTDQPASATAGEMRVDTTTATTVVYTGTQWKTLKETAFVVPPVPTHFLVVAGGGAGGRSANNTGSGAGGAGGLRTSYGSTSGGNSSAESNIEISLNTPYNITVGNGGAGTTTATNGNQGTSSTFSTITSIGGGGGFIQRSGSASTVNGGSGGGGEGFTTSTGGSGNPGNGFGTGTADQGKDGGVGSNSASAYGGGGGGGAITVGGSGSSTSGGSGGTGLESSITGTATFFAGGGGGGSSTATGGTGGSGIGGNGGSSVTGSGAGDNGVFNTGSGGGGGGNMVGGAGGSGGSGVVILRYPTADLPYFTTTGTLNTPSATDTVADTAYPVTNLAYYKLDNNANDSGLGSGYIGQGGIFNGSSSKIDLPNGAGSTGAITVSTWINTNNISTTQGIWSFGSTSGYAVECLIESGYLFFRMLNSSGTAGFGIQTGTGYISNNTWHNIVCIFPNTTASNACKIYIDGVERITGTSTLGSVTRNTSNSGLGGRFYSGSLSLPFTGSIDQVRIFPTVLSSSNIALLYAETSATSSTLNYPVTATALYEFSGNANDTGGTYNGTATNVLYAYNGTATNVTYENGRFNEAANLTATNGSIEIPGLTPSQFSATNVSVSVWVNMTSLVASGKGIYLFNVGSGSFQIQVTSSGVNFYKYNGTNYAAVYSTPLNLNQWYHIAATASTTAGMKLYLNGTEVASNSFTGTIDLTYNDIGWGYYNDYADRRGFSGLIDQGRIFSSALAPGDVEDLYNEHFQTKFTDGSDTALMFTGGTGDITFADTAPVFTPGDNFNTVLYTGNGGTQAITGLGFQPDFVWIKQRTFTESHSLFDTVRGVDLFLRSDTTAAENNFGGTYGVNSFDSNGFTVGNGSAVNGNGYSMVGWSWKAGGAARNNTKGTLTSTISANVDAGFSIVKYTGDNSSSATIGHGLGKMPAMVMTKMSEQSGGASSTSQWMIYHKDLTGNVSGDNPYNLYFSTNAELDLTAFGAYDNITTDVIPVTRTSASTAHNNNNLSTYVAYCFAEIAGYSKIGSFLGNGSTVNVVTGFEPAFIMWKNISQGNASYDYWFTVDNKRSPSNPVDKVLYPNDSIAETTTAYTIANFNSNGFDIVGSAGGRVFNNSGDTYIFMAFATNPT